MTKLEILQSNIEDIKREYLSGISTYQLGKKFKCNPALIWKILSNNNVQIRKRSDNYGGVIGRKDEIISLFNNGYSAYKISKELKISKPVILRYLEEWGCDTSSKNKVNTSNLLKNKSNLVIRLHNEGKSQTEIAEITGHKSGSVCRIIQELGLEKRDWKYSIDESFFEKIDSQEKSYILGWFYSDGNVTSGGRCRISIQKRDGDIIRWIASQLKYDGPLYEKQAKNERSQPQIEICFHRKKMADDLIRLGCIPNKSLVLQLPSFDLVPENIFSHFIRGVFDGDGSFLRRGNSLGVNITSSVDFCHSLSDYIEELGLANQVYYKGNSASINITKTDYALRFGQWLYKDATICLQRKRAKLDEIAG